MSTPPGRAPEPGRPTPDLVRLGLVVSLGAIMMQLDTTMTNVATATLLRTFDVPLTTLQWVGTGYLIAMATVIPLGGWAMERFGGRAVWTASLGVFLLGSVLSGLAWSVPSLIAFRVVQGLGAGLILPVAQAVLAVAAGPDRLARAMAVLGVPALLGPVLGPVLGGVIVTDLSWRWIFYVNVPVCLLALALARRTVPADRIGVPGRLDLLGTALLSGGSVALVAGFADAGRAGTFATAGAVAPLALGVALFGGFVRHALAVRGVAIIDVRLLRERAFGSAGAVMFLGMTVMFGTMSVVPLYYQQVRGESPLRAGLLMVPFGVGTGVSLILGSRLVARLGARRLALGGLTALLMGNLALTRLDAGTAYPLIGAVQLVGGLGVGTVLVPVMTASLQGLRADQIPRASTAVRLLQQLGACFGGALLLVVLQHRITVGAAAHGGRADAAVLGHAFGESFWWPLAIGVVTLAAAAFLPGPGARAPEPAPALPASSPGPR